MKCHRFLVYFETHLTPIIQFVRNISSILQTWQNDRIWRLFVFWFHQKSFTTIYVWTVMNAYNRVDFEFLVAISASLPSATTCLERPYLLGPLGGRYIQVLLYIFILDLTPGFNTLGKGNCKMRLGNILVWGFGVTYTGSLTVITGTGKIVKAWDMSGEA